jgi:hypothetical protein
MNSERGRYQRHKDRVRRSQDEMVAAGQEIGPLPPIKDPGRRRAASDSLRLFYEFYLPKVFNLAWSPDHLFVIGELEWSITHGGLVVIAMPRGSGKSAMIRGAAQWAILTGRRRFVSIVAANDIKAAGELGKIQTVCETNAELIADFPEVLWPVAKLDRIAQRQKGQTYLGTHTRMVWLSDKLVFPTIPGSRSSGSIIMSAGLTTSDIRGQSHQTSEGELLRPDYVLIDDPQTAESAGSDLQCEQRETLISADVLGMAGNDAPMAGSAAVTCIRNGDVATRLLNPERSPDWDGHKTRMLNSLPANMDLWDRYADLRRQGKEGRKQADAMYLARQVEMDAGAEASWPARKPGCLSAIQYAMNLRIRDRRVFEAEYQNDPLGPEEDETKPTLEGLQQNLNRHKRGLIPAWATHVVSFIDVQEKALYYLVLAAADDFTCAVVEYQCWPEQPRDYFTLRDIRKTLASELKKADKTGGIESAIAYGLECLTEELAARHWARDDGTELRMEQILIDSGDHAKAVYEFCRSAKHGSIMLPSKGKGFSGGTTPIDQWKIKDHDKRGYGHVITSDPKKRTVRLVTFDTNLLKTFACHRRATVGKGALTVYGDSADAHRMLQDHCMAETPTKKLKVWEWKHKPGAPDNHLFDCLVGAMLAAILCGCVIDAHRDATPKKKRKKVQVSF